ncbi:MAG TPA: sulfite exporter TauE/SafE family protein [Planctomycetota bacterium]|nr:sulfite exporter TauE/SafE family protein [Planctomycetota bacterium]
MTLSEGMTWSQGAILAASAVGAGAVNSMAGGGTLLSFPALVHGAGLDLRSANATSTVAIWPGAWGSMAGYRKDLQDARHLVAALALPSLLGGAVGAWLLLVTDEETFGYVVPWLILFATVLFAAKGWLAPDAGTGGPKDPRPGPAAMAYQFAVATYGGYFGAGAGILMLAMLGWIGMKDIHRMNGVKMAQAMLLNTTAIAIFALTPGLVAWPQAGVMTVGALAGGYGGARLARVIPQAGVRAFVVVAGLVIAGIEFKRSFGW